MLKKIRDSYSGQPSLISTKDDRTLPKDFAEEQIYAEHKVTGKTYNWKKNRICFLLLLLAVNQPINKVKALTLTFYLA